MTHTKMAMWVNDMCSVSLECRLMKVPCVLLFLIWI